MKKKFKIGEICVRCGATKKENHKYPSGCGIYGDWKSRHSYNKEAVTIEEVEVKITNRVKEILKS